MSTKFTLFPEEFASSSNRKSCQRLQPGCLPSHDKTEREVTVGLQYYGPWTPPAQHPPRRVTTRLSRCLALSPAHLCPRPFRPSLPLRPVSRRQRRRRRLAQLVGSLYKGKKQENRTAGAAAGGGSGGAGSGDWWWFPSLARGGERATPPRPPKGRGIFFFLKGDSRGF